MGIVRMGRNAHTAKYIGKPLRQLRVPIDPNPTLDSRLDFNYFPTDLTLGYTD